MSDIGSMVSELIAAGCAPEVAAKVVAGAFIAGANSANFRGIPVDENAEKRRAYDRERKRYSAEIRRKSADSAEIPNAPLSIDNSKKERRGTRLYPDSQLSAEYRDFARSLGWSDAQIEKEWLNFRDYWIAQPGNRGVKADWLATWRKWTRSSKVKPAGPSGIVAPLDRNWDAAAKSWLRFRTWPKGYGPDPDSPACQCPPEILEKHRGAA